MWGLIYILSRLLAFMRNRFFLCKILCACLFVHAFSYKTCAFLRVISMMQYWLMKSEPDELSIADALAAAGQTVAWVGVRNYQARNFMRDQMRPGDGVLFYHSSCPAPGIAGLARVASHAYPDPTQFDPASKYYDAKASRAEPRWSLVDIEALQQTRLLALGELRTVPALAEMRILARGNRLSITPVTPAEWRCITGLLGLPA
jgi:predicted RNA-binding protein with PUA-like domain